jgi:hypothetical protein
MDRKNFEKGAPVIERGALFFVLILTICSIYN